MTEKTWIVTRFIEPSYNSKEEAQERAKKLAKDEGRTFYVWEIIGVAEVADRPVNYFELP